MQARVRVPDGRSSGRDVGRNGNRNRWIGASRAGLFFATLLCLAPMRLGAQSPLDGPARLTVDNVTVDQALRQLRRSAGVSLLYSPDLLPEDRRVSCACERVTVREALEQILEGTGLTFRSSSTQIRVVPVPHADGPPPGATGLLAGRVIGVETGQPVVSAMVELDGAPGAPSPEPVPVANVERTGNGRRTVTGNDGRFAFSDVPAGTHQLRIVALGYEEAGVTVSMGVAATRSVRVGLRPLPLPLDAVVIAPGRVGILEADPGVSGVMVTREDIEAIPQFGDDSFRTLKRMPGVATGDLSAKLHVRGSTPKNLLVRLDGLVLDEPYHLKDFDGVFGIVDVQALGSMELVTGGFPAEFGDRWGGLLDMRSRRPPPGGGTRTTAGLSLSSASVNSQGSFADGRGQWLASLRRGYLDIVLGIAGDDDDLSPAYWDALARIQYLIADDHVLSAEVLHAGDDVVAGETGSEERVESTWADTYAWVTWDATFAPRVRVETVLSAGRLDRNRKGVGSAPGDGVFKPTGFHVSDNSAYRFGQLRQDWKLDIADAFLLKAGFDLRFGRSEYDYLAIAGWRRLDPDGHIVAFVDTTAAKLEPDGHRIGVYTALRGRGPGDLTWEFGARFDRTSHTGDADLAPRLMLRWDAGPRTSVKGSWGSYYQSQGVGHLRVSDGETEFSRTERANQVAVGVERRFGGGLTGRAEAYLRQVDHLGPIYVNPARELHPVMEVMGDRTRLAPTRGRARGLEILLSGDGAGPLSWSAGYVLARTEIEVDRTWIPRTYDQTHTVNLYAAYRPGPKWQLSGSWQYHSGWPVTAQFLENRQGEGEGEGTITLRTFGPLNAERLLPYHRLDLRVTRAFEFERSRLELYADIFNVYDHTNLGGYDYYLPAAGSAQTGTLRQAGDELFPRLPTIGFRWIF